VADPGAVARARSAAGKHANRLLHHPLLRVVCRRLVLSIPLLFIVSFLSFLLVSLTPGDAARRILGLNGTQEQYAKLRQALGLDQPIYEQYWHWLKGAVHGDLGASLFSGESVTHAISTRLPVTLSLVIGALIVMLVVGVTVGVYSAVRGGLIGRLLDAVTLAGFAVPGFWVATILISLFAVRVQWFPATGYVPLTQSVSEWLQALVLPILALALGGLAAIAKQTREAMLDVLASEHIRMARANGIPPKSIVSVYALKNSGIRILTILGLQAVALLGGTVLIENVFALPGLGSLLVNASLTHDLPMVQGVVVFFAVIIVLINLIIDLAYAWLDPRVRTQ